MKDAHPFPIILCIVLFALSVTLSAVLADKPDQVCQSVAPKSHWSPYLKTCVHHVPVKSKEKP